MNRMAVSSDNIVSIGWDAGSEVLEVEFKRGAVYQYERVPQSVFNGLMGASSHGGYLADRVKGVYEYRRVS